MYLRKSRFYFCDRDCPVLGEDYRPKSKLGMTAFSTLQTCPAAQLASVWWPGADIHWFLIFRLTKRPERTANLPCPGSVLLSWLQHFWTLSIFLYRYQIPLPYPRRLAFLREPKQDDPPCLRPERHGFRKVRLSGAKAEGARGSSHRTAVSTGAATGSQTALQGELWALPEVQPSLPG